MITNSEIIEKLEKIAKLLQLKGESPFKIIAYTNAAEYIRVNQPDIYNLVNDEKLGELTGFGDALVSKITNFVQTGKMDYFEKLISEIPESVLELFNLSGLGPKKIEFLFRELNIQSIDDLYKACNENKIANLKGFSKKSEEDLMLLSKNYLEGNITNKKENKFKEIR